jgi:hypothetical protein
MSDDAESQMNDARNEFEAELGESVISLAALEGDLVGLIDQLEQRRREITALLLLYAMHAASVGAPAENTVQEL